MTARHKLRFEKIPAGFVRHRGKACPFPLETRVELVIHTAEGLGFAGPCKAKLHDWDSDNHPDGIGAIVAYRRVAAA